MRLTTDHLIAVMFGAIGALALVVAWISTYPRLPREPQKARYATNVQLLQDVGGLTLETTYYDPTTGVTTYETISVGQDLTEPDPTPAEEDTP